VARQTYNTRPYEKHLETYANFSAGLNTVSSQDNMLNQELRDAVNVDLAEQGAIRRRHGMTRYLTPPATGLGQGYFRYFKEGGLSEEITAVGGKLYKDGAELPITDLTSFQNTRPIEAVQFGDKLYIATGTKLVQYDGTTAQVVEPYKPEPLEALYIGTNGLADDPNNFMQDGESTFMRIDGVTFSSRYGIVNQPVTLTAFISKPVEKSVEFQFEWRYAFMEEGKWVLGQDWSAEKQWSFTPDMEGDFQFRINLRESGNTVAETQYLVPKYKVNASQDSSDVEIDTQYLQRCNRILLHWNRLILYGDTENPDMIYISHLNKPDYFPVPNTLRFENGKKEALTSLVQYRDMVIAFTPSTIQALFGKGPSDYHRAVLNTSIGCIAPFSTAVVKNYIYFLSSSGVHYLKSVGYVDDKANVEKLDSKIDNLVPRDTDACGIFHNNQYHLVFPSKKQRFRFYVELGAWIKDESEKMDFTRLYEVDGWLRGHSQTGYVSQFDPTVYADEGYAYMDAWETKYFDFGQPYHTKKLKEVQFTLAPETDNMEASVYVYADSSSVLSPKNASAYVDENGEVGWKVDIQTNLTSYTGAEMGEWELGNNPFGDVLTSVEKLSVSGKCYRTKVRFEHTDPTPSKCLGIAYIFKVKKP
jgi:hypothetical protein